jgi:hypothetical protein
VNVRIEKNFRLQPALLTAQTSVVYQACPFPVLFVYQLNTYRIALVPFKKMSVVHSCSQSLGISGNPFGFSEIPFCLLFFSGSPTSAEKLSEFQNTAWFLEPALTLRAAVWGFYYFIAIPETILRSGDGSFYRSDLFKQLAD